MFAKHARVPSDPLPLHHTPNGSMPQLGSHSESEQSNNIIFLPLTLSLIQLDRGTALWHTFTVAADNTLLLTVFTRSGGFKKKYVELSVVD